jgi:LPS export ABC transporter protein LptC
VVVRRLATLWGWGIRGGFPFKPRAPLWPSSGLDWACVDSPCTATYTHLGQASGVPLQVIHVKLLRRLLIAIIIAVLSAVGINYVQTWRHRARIVRQTAKILSTDMMRSADSLEYSEQENGVVHFQLRAERLLETKQGKSLLEGIEASVRNPDGTTRSQIRSRKAQYDRDGKKAYFSTDVRIRTSEGGEIHTESLTYDLGRNVGETDERIEFDTKDLHGTARGVRYDNASKDLDLLSDVDFTVQRRVHSREGGLQSQTVRGKSQRGHYSEQRRIIQWSGNARLESDTDVLSGSNIEASFSEDRKRFTALVCRGNAVFQAKTAGETRSLRGDRMSFGINQESGALQKIDVFGQAVFITGSNSSGQVLQGSEIHVDLDHERGLPRLLSAVGKVRFEARRGDRETLLQGEKLDASFKSGQDLLEKMRVWGAARMTASSPGDSSGDELQAEEIRISFGELQGRSILRQLDADRSVRWESSERGNSAKKKNDTKRSLTAATLQMQYSEAGDYVQSGSAAGNVVLAGLARDALSKQQVRRLKADTVYFQFFPRENKLQSFDGNGHVEVTYYGLSESDKEGAAQEFRTTSNNLHADFSQPEGDAQDISQWGNFVLQDGVRTATAGRGDYSAAKDTLILRDSPKISDPGGTTSGDQMTYDRKQKILLTQGHVRSLIRQKEAGGSTSSDTTSKSASPNVVTASEMQYWTEESHARYTGRVQMLSENGQLQARSLSILESGERVEAEGEVAHLIPRSAPAHDAQKGAQAPAKAGTAPNSEAGRDGAPILIRSRALRYQKAKNMVHYEGGVTLQTTDLWMSSESLDAVFQAGEQKIEKAAARGQVRIRQGGREVRGQAGDYFLTPGMFVVTGELAEILDPEKGKSAARRLTFYTADDRILLENR